jgi:hypothetical protein
LLDEIRPLLRQQTETFTASLSEVPALIQLIPERSFERIRPLLQQQAETFTGLAKELRAFTQSVPKKLLDEIKPLLRQQAEAFTASLSEVPALIQQNLFERMQSLLQQQAEALIDVQMFLQRFTDTVTEGVSKITLSMDTLYVSTNRINLGDLTRYGLENVPLLAKPHGSVINLALNRYVEALWQCVGELSSSSRLLDCITWFISAIWGNNEELHTSSSVTADTMRSFSPGLGIAVAVFLQGFPSAESILGVNDVLYFAKCISVVGNMALLSLLMEFDCMAGQHHSYAALMSAWADVKQACSVNECIRSHAIENDNLIASGIFNVEYQVLTKTM